MPATYEDAALVLQIVRWGTEMGINDSGTGGLRIRLRRQGRFC